LNKYLPANVYGRTPINCGLHIVTFFQRLQYGGGERITEEKPGKFYSGQKMKGEIIG
jgi:hypothetical protein